MKRLATAVFILILLILAVAVALLVNLATENPVTSNLIFAMPEEYINYTVTCINGTLWAKIDGVYPIRILSASGGDLQCDSPDELPMVYPIPPDAINICVKMNETELGWSNYSYDTHHTAIGDWSMIYCVIKPVSDYFVLKIHYEHPVQLINGSYVFLYDLNIRE